MTHNPFVRHCCTDVYLNGFLDGWWDGWMCLLIPFRMCVCIVFCTVLVGRLAATRPNTFQRWTIFITISTYRYPLVVHTSSFSTLIGWINNELFNLTYISIFFRWCLAVRTFISIQQHKNSWSFTLKHWIDSNFFANLFNLATLVNLYCPSGWLNRTTINDLKTTIRNETN